VQLAELWFVISSLPQDTFQNKNLRYTTDILYILGFIEDWIMLNYAFNRWFGVASGVTRANGKLEKILKEETPVPAAKRNISFLKIV